jgi:Domain of unknown function (DUF4389)
MEPASAPYPESGYPATFAFDPPEKIANWRPLVQWLLAIPHFVVLYLLNIVSEAIGVISWFVILFTGKLPEGLANLQALYLRYNVRASTYAAFLQEEYPPFAFATTSSDPGDYPRMRVDLHPALEDRNRLTTAFRIFLVLPHLIVLAFLGIAAVVVVLIAFFAVLFTGRWPVGLRDFALGVNRWVLRVHAYFLLLTDEYPPFSLD